MFDHLQISDPRERVLVGLADLALRAGTAPFRLRQPPDAAPPDRILLLRLERIGDLLMTVAAIADVRAQAPSARIDLVTGSWNGPLARLIPGVDAVEALDAPWLSRTAGSGGYGALVQRARRWRRRRYDLAINFEGDIRSNLLLALSGAPRRIGFGMAGGAPLLTTCVPYDPARHVAVNAVRLLDEAFGRPGPSGARRLEGWPADEAARLDRLRAAPPALRFPPAAAAKATALLGALPPGLPLVGVHVSGGRAIKQWAPDRFADLAARLASARGATIVMTGASGDRPLVDRVRGALPSGVRVVDVAGALDIVGLGALLARLDVFITGDTGPMHLAAAAGAPVVAIFGPSSPVRWGPLTRRARILRADLACSPCNRIRRPPARCVGHVPDCLVAVTVDQAYAAALDLLAPEETPPDDRGAPA